MSAGHSHLGIRERTRPTVAAIVVAVASEIAAGVLLGFGAPVGHVLFLSFAALLVTGALAVGETPIESAVIAYGAVVLIGLVLGSAGLVRPVWYLAAEIVLWVAAVFTRRTMTSSRPERLKAAIPPIGAGFAAALVAFVLGYGLSHSPYTAYDALSYHLFFPARWLQAHGLSIIPTPFSDEAQAYQPSNGELWFLWLMLPFRGDLLARIGQAPFYLLGAATVYALALRCGATRNHALYAPALFLVAPPMVEQAVGANVDLIAAVMFVVSLHLGIAASDRQRSRDWAIYGMAIGLFLGTKYLSLAYVPILVVIPLLRGVTWRAAWALPGILALGAPWYLRNWAIAGSPIYPATLTVAGVTLGRGAYTHAAMLRTFMHTTQPRLLAVALVHAFGTPFFVLCAAIGSVAAVQVVKRRSWWPAGALFVAGAGVVVLCWTAVGDNSDSRFLLPSVALVPALLPLAFGSSDRANRVIHMGLTVGIAGVLIGINRELQVDAPWFMEDWLPFHGVLDGRYLLPFIALVVTAACVSVFASRRALLGAASAVFIAAGAATLCVYADRACRPWLCDYLQVSRQHVHTNIIYAAAWVSEHVKGANVAYTGINLPYPFVGSHLSNTVYYVNIDRHPSWRFDQYAAAYRRASAVTEMHWPLAKPSGVLLPSASLVEPIDAVRPRFERRDGDRESWKNNLRRAEIRYLVVAKLDAYEIDYSWHDARGFPIENQWASTDKESFVLVYENDDVRVYEVTF